MGCAPHNFLVKGYEHVGIRVSDRTTAVRFYETLGWHEEVDLPEFSANEMVNSAGVRINLIFNAAPRKIAGHNILQDEKEKIPGITHVAFVVDSLSALMEWLAARKIAVTEGPVEFDDRRSALFIRDPDGNVLEFNQMGSES